MIPLFKEYAEDTLVRTAHHFHSANNKITLNETVPILLHNTIAENISICEFYEVKNHRRAFDYMLEYLDQEVSISTIHDMIYLLLKI